MAETRTGEQAHAPSTHVHTEALAGRGETFRCMSAAAGVSGDRVSALISIDYRDVFVQFCAQFLTLVKQHRYNTVTIVVPCTLTWKSAKFCVEYVCLSVRSHISETTRPNFAPIFVHVPVAVARSVSSSVDIRYVLPILWMTSSESSTALCFEEIRQVAVPVGRHRQLQCLVAFTRMWRRGRSLISRPMCDLLSKNKIDKCTGSARKPVVRDRGRQVQAKVDNRRLYPVPLHCRRYRDARVYTCKRVHDMISYISITK